MIDQSITSRSPFPHLLLQSIQVHLLSRKYEVSASSPKSFLAERMAATYLDAIMLFGDSITQGAWEFNGIGARLARKSVESVLLMAQPQRRNSEPAIDWIWLLIDVYARKLDVLNRGYSGYNTEWALPVFEKVKLPMARILRFRYSTSFAYAKLTLSPTPRFSQSSMNRNTSPASASSPSGSARTTPASRNRHNTSPSPDSEKISGLSSIWSLHRRLRITRRTRKSCSLRHHQ